MKNLAIAFIVVCLLSAPAFGAQRRVFTNEDVATTPPPAPPADEISSDPSATTESGAPEARPSDLPSTPMADLNRVKAIQATFMGLYDEISVKASEDATPGLKQRWTDINLWLSSIIQANQKTIQELQDLLGIEPSDESALPASTQSAPPAPGPAESPAQ